jgi:calcineurin-like phosphoesterase family protein
MHKIKKFKWEDKDKLFFTSDWHIFHNPIHWQTPIWESRGYPSLESSVEDVILKINERVKHDDILFCLGDCFLNATDDQVLNWLSRIKCQNIYKLWGNHTSNTYRLYKQEVLKQFGRDDIEVYPIRVGNVEFYGNHLEILVGKQRIILNHFPLRIWHKNGHGSWNLSGHSHMTDKGRHPDAPYHKGLDCGWDWKNAVWSFDEISDVMSTKEREILDHHDQFTT